MKIDTGKISPAQFMCSVACFIQSSNLLASFFMAITKQDSWIVVFIGFALSLPFLWIFVALMRIFPKKNLIEINDVIFGRIGGKVVSFMYLLFFATLAALNLRDVTSFVHQSIAPKTPVPVILIVFILVCSWAVRSGINVVTRYSTSFTIIAFAVIVATTIFTIGMMEFKNFLPVLQLPPKKYIQGAHIIATIPFGELMVFLMITPNIRLAGKGFGKYFLWGFIIGGISMLIIVIRDIAVLGNAIILVALPPFETIRMASLTPMITRMEIFFAVALIVLLFFKVSFLYYITVMAISRIFGMDSFKPLVLSVGAILFAYTNIVASTSMHNSLAGSQTTPVLWVLFEYLLPTITLICAKIKKIPQGEVTT